jgi:cell division protein FtsQ
VAATPRGQPPARARALALPQILRRGVEAPRFVPSRLSLALGLGLLALAGAAYAAARETPAFAVTRIEVSGGPRGVAAQVRRQLAPVRGTSLLALDGSAVERRLESLPTIVSGGYDRSFPHTLRLVVVPERPVALLRRGRQGWLVSARARVIARLQPRSRADLPRIWVPTTTSVRAGSFLGGTAAGTARALAAVVRFPAPVGEATLLHGSLVFRLRSGLDLRLGAASDIRLKLAIARRALPLLPTGATYLDVSVPGRPVAGTTNAQLSARG